MLCSLIGELMSHRLVELASQAIFYGAHSFKEEGNPERVDLVIYQPKLATESSKACLVLVYPDIDRALVDERIFNPKGAWKSGTGRGR